MSGASKPLLALLVAGSMLTAVGGIVVGNRAVQCAEAFKDRALAWHDKAQELQRRLDASQAVRAELEAKLEELNTQKAELEATKATLEAALDTIEIGFKEAENGQNQADNQFAAAEAQLDAAELQIDLVSAEEVEEIVALNQGVAELGVRDARSALADAVLDELTV